MSIAIALFTRDLRVHDNPVLTAAHRGADSIVPLFVVDDAIVGGKDMSPNRARFLTDSLAQLDEQLAEMGGRLVIRRGRVVDEVLRLVHDLGVAEVHIAADVSGYAQKRERELRERLEDIDCRLEAHSLSVTVVEPGAITPTGGRDHFAVFTPYFRRWSQAPKRPVLRKPQSLHLAEVESERLPTQKELCPGDVAEQLPGGGETTGRCLLKDWLAGPIDDYEDQHDALAGDATSRLSPYLHFGCVSSTELVSRSAEKNSPGAEAFVRQVAWRDFHHQVLAARPESARVDYRPRGDRWVHDERLAQAWRDGRTGYPIVDAGMRQLLGQGWMHNRARMITASFLTKTLYLDWRIGAAHFMYHLADADVANNQMNWQWIAGTGNDSRPNRVLNPLRQAERYDADGEYVRRWVPELRAIPGSEVHTPWKLPKGEVRGYPAPIVNHRAGAEAFHAARSEKQ